MPMQVIKRGGVIALDKSKRYILVVLGKGHNKWSLPKGAKEETESYRRCALRELEEETGLTFTLGDQVMYHLGCRYYSTIESIESIEKYEPRPYDIKEVRKAEWKLVESLHKCKCNSGLKRAVKMIECGKV